MLGNLAVRSINFGPRGRQYTQRVFLFRRS